MKKKFIVIGIMAFAFMVPAGLSAKSNFDVTIEGSIYAGVHGKGNAKAVYDSSKWKVQKKTYRVTVLNELVAKTEAKKQFNNEFTVYTSAKDAKGKVKDTARKPQKVKVISSVKELKETPAPKSSGKSKNMTTEDALNLMAGAKNQNTKEIRDALNTIQNVLGGIKDTNVKKPKTKIGKYYEQIKALNTLFKLAEESKTANDAQKQNLAKQMANINLDLLGFVVSEKGPKIYNQVVPVVCDMAKSVVNSYSAYYADVAWLEAVQIEASDRIRHTLDNEEYAGIGKELRAKGVSLEKIADVFKALDVLKKAAVK